MKALTAEYELSNGMQLRLVRAATGVHVILANVDPADARRFPKHTETINPNDIDALSACTGRLMTQAFGSATDDAASWSRIYKALGRFKRLPEEKPDPAQREPEAGKKNKRK
jgi:hypothetical protein